MSRFSFAVAVAMVAVSSLLQADDAKSPNLPEKWLADWRDPPLECRPLQIVHGFHPKRATLEGMTEYKNLGLGGVVCNVGFNEYMKSEKNWKILLDGVEACDKLGLSVWLYDEFGYPSGSAGGLVLAEDKSLEASELAFDAAAKNPFLIRPAYEYTHACNCYSTWRRYINLLDERATACFIKNTHENYRKRLEKYFGRTIKAFFTDEPSMIAVNIGTMPENIAKKRRIADPLDPNYRELPCVPWTADLPERFREKYGQDLNAQRKSLFTGDTPADRRLRQRFWSLVAELNSERYYGQIQQWCQKNCVVSSGHSLAEENFLFHVPLDGNKLKTLGRMDIPGMDQLASVPEHHSWMTPAMPLSAALLNGRRLLMSEVSSFHEVMTEKGPVTLDAMQSTAAWHAAWGITEFTLYYKISDYSPEDYKAYCRYVGRLNSVLRAADPMPEVLLYYPICDAWAEYLPTAGKLRADSQSPTMQKIIDSFGKLGKSLKSGQIPFIVIDHENLLAAKIDAGKIIIGNRKFATLVIPEGVKLIPAVKKMVARFQASGGRVPAETDKVKFRGPAIIDAVKPAYRLSPAAPKIELGRFQRDGRTILILANTGDDVFDGEISMTRKTGTLTKLNPKTGVIESAALNAKGKLPLKLGAFEAVLLVE